MMHQPQEIEVWYVIPSIRKEIAIELKNLGETQTKISDILGLTKSAVSQYINNKRAKKNEFTDDIINKIKDSSKKISKDPKIITNEIQEIIKEIRKTGLLCKYHRKYSKINEKCNICME